MMANYYFSLHNDQGKFKVAIQNLISNQVLKLTKGPADESPIFAPNGHLILFTYKDYGKTTKIGTVSINGLKRVANKRRKLHNTGAYMGADNKLSCVLTNV